MHQHELEATAIVVAIVVGDKTSSCFFFFFFSLSLSLSLSLSFSLSFTSRRSHEPSRYRSPLQNDGRDIVERRTRIIFFVDDMVLVASTNTSLCKMRTLAKLSAAWRQGVGFTEFGQVNGSARFSSISFEMSKAASLVLVSPGSTVLRKGTRASSSRRDAYVACPTGAIQVSGRIFFRLPQRLTFVERFVRLCENNVRILHDPRE